MDIRIDGKRSCDRCGGRKTPLLPHVCAITRASPVARESITPDMTMRFGSTPAWAPPVYGEYYATSVPIYAAVKRRADSLIRPKLVTLTRKVNGDTEPLAQEHAFSQVMRKVNPFWTFQDLMRATSTYLDLWGSAYWVLTKAGPQSAPTEIWPLRPDRVRVVADQGKYIKGFTYASASGQPQSLDASEVVWFRYFNPLDEFAGMSPIAPARLGVDMASEATRFNRDMLRNGLMVGNLAIQSQSVPTEEDLEDFYQRMKARYAGGQNAWKPLVLNPGMDAKNLGLNQKDMEFIQSLRWSLEEAARAFQVPLILLEDLSHATYSNVDAAERMFWRNSIIPQLIFIRGQINEILAPQFGPDLEVDFNLSDIEALQEDANSRATRDRADIAAGIVTVNEVRGDRGLEPVAWGDAWWAPIGVTPVTDATPAPVAPAISAPAEGQPPKMVKRHWLPPVLTPSVIAEVKAAHIKRLARGEAMFSRMQHKLFEEQARAIVDAISKHPEFAAPTAKGFGEPIWVLTQWLKVFRDAGFPVFAAIFGNAGQSAMAQVNLGQAFDMTAPGAKGWLDSRVAFWAQSVNEETGRLLMREIEAGRAAGESIAQIQDRVSVVFGISDAMRTERIARTETQASANHATLEAFQQSGVADRKMWIAVHDDRTRDAHLEADGQIVPLDAPFIVGGETLDTPGEGSPENAINCRCTLGAVFPGEQRAVTAPIITAHRNGHKLMGAKS